MCVRQWGGEDKRSTVVDSRCEGCSVTRRQDHAGTQAIRDAPQCGRSYTLLTRVYDEDVAMIESLTVVFACATPFPT